MSIQEKVYNLPTFPGVYLMKDSLGHVIYVGKAKNLKKRVQTYFRDIEKHSPKIKKLIKHLVDFDYIVTDTEFEAFLLECTLIKELKPPYNRIMKNPLSFTYVMIGIESPLHTIKIIHNPIENDKNLIFGPYTSKHTVESAINGIKECFKILCNNPTSNGSTCLNYSLDLCIGLCTGDFSIVQYNNNIINKVVALLNETNTELLQDLKQLMIDASDEFDFESAAKYRDTIDAVKSLLKTEQVIKFTEADHNILIIEHLNQTTFKLLLIKRTKVLLRKKYLLSDTPLETLIPMIQLEIFNYFNVSDHFHKDVSRDEIDVAQIIYRYLNSKKDCCIIIPDNWITKENKNMEVALLSLLTRETTDFERLQKGLILPSL